MFRSKLSRKLYDKLAEDVANELVDWGNDRRECFQRQVDGTYRADLRELNELNYTRFEAKLEQRLAEFAARWDGRLSELDSKWETRLAQSDARWDSRLARLETEVAKGLADVKSGLKWMYAFWAPTALAVIGTGAGVIGLLIRR